MRKFLKYIGTVLNEDGEDVLPTQMQPVSIMDFNEYLAPYVGKENKLTLLLDYDGTLAPIKPHPDLAVIPPETKEVSAKTDQELTVLRHKVILSRFWKGS